MAAASSQCTAGVCPVGVASRPSPPTPDPDPAMLHSTQPFPSDEDAAKLGPNPAKVAALPAASAFASPDLPASTAAFPTPAAPPPAYPPASTAAYGSPSPLPHCPSWTID